MSNEIPELAKLWGASYSIVQRLGRGGYATVFKAVQRTTGQTVAIKVQRLDPDQTPEERATRIARFDRETRLCQTLRHPNIVRMIESGQNDRFMFIVFEFVPGETLSQLLSRRRYLPAEEACRLMADVLDALAGAHSQGVLHRDLKPDNIMVEPRGEELMIRVLDFGVGAFVPGTIEGAATLTRSHEILGTPCYAAPEQLRGEPATTRSDIYAWGLVFVECLTGQRVIEGSTMAQVFQKQLSPLEVPLPPALTSHPLAGLLRRALAKSSAERASDAARLAAELRRIPVADLVGLLSQSLQSRPPRTLALDARQPVAEQRHVTALSFSLTVSCAAQDTLLDLETLDAVQRDQMSLCIDLVRRFGGHVAGTLANRMLVLFGFPEAMSGDARRAGRAALELSSRLQARRRLLASQRGIELEFRMGLHTGSVIVDASGNPAGPALNLASRLEGVAEAQNTLVTEATRQLLEPYLRFRPVTLELPGRAYALVSEKASPTLDVQQTGTERGPIFGRVAELQILQNRLNKARAGQGSLVLIRGEPGIGKSRLVQEICRRALETGSGVLDGQCLLEDKNSALRPVVSLVRRYFELDEALERGLQRIEALLDQSGAREATAILCSWLDFPKPEGYPDTKLSAEAQRKVLLEALGRILSHAGRSEAHLVVIEDVQWADPTTVELLRGLAQDVSTRHALVLLTARPEFEPLIEAAEIIELSGLPQEEVERLLSDRLGDLQLSRETRARIIQRTDGVPLFVDELTRSLLRAAEQESGALHEPNIPDSLRDLLSSRLDGLGQGKETAQLASAIGREFSLDLLGAISLRGTETLQGDLDSLVQSELVLRRATQDGARYVFRHALIQEAAWESMLPSQRLRVHRNIAEVLETKFEDQSKQEPARLARHYELGQVPDKAIALRLLSAQQAARSLAYLESVAHARAGLNLVSQLPDRVAADNYALELNNILGGMLSAAQGFAGPELVEAFTRCQSLLETTNPPPLQRLMTQKGLWTFHNARADYSSASLLVAQMLNLADAHPEPIFKAGAHTSACQTALLMGRFDEALQHARACDDWFQPDLQREMIASYGLDPWLSALVFECYANAALGRFRAARKAMQRAAQAATELADASVLCTIQAEHAWLELLLNGCAPDPRTILADAEASARRSLAAAEQLGFQFKESYARLMLAMIGCTYGEEGSVRSLAVAIDAWQRAGIAAFLGWQWSYLAQGQLAISAYADALVSAQAALKHCEDTGENYALSEAYRVLGLTLSEPATEFFAPKEACEAFAKALSIARVQGARLFELRAAYSFALRASGEQAGLALQELTSVLASFRQSGEQSRLVTGGEALLRAAGHG